MIRTILAVLITVAIVAMALPAMEHAAGARGTQQTQAAIAELENAAESLHVAESVPPRGVSGPQRTLTLTFPTDDMTVDPVSTFEIERAAEGHTVIRYSIDNRPVQVVHVEAPIVDADFEDTLEYGQITGTHQFRLTLQRHPDTGKPVVVLERL